MGTHASRPGGTGRLLARWLAQGLALVITFALGAVAMHLGMHAQDPDRIQTLQAQAETLQAQLAQSWAEQAALRSEIVVQDGTRQVLQAKLDELQKSLGHTREQLAFYEQLIPPGPAGAIAVRGFDIRPDGEFLHYRVLLTRNAPAQSDPFKGRMRFVAQGLHDGKTVKMDLTPPVASDSSGDTDTPQSGADPLSLVFEQFQRSTGVLQQVPGLQIQSIHLEILEDDIVRATQDIVLNRADPVRAGALP